MDIFIFGIIILIALAVSDLIVGVSNDAVNFLNSSIGSKVAPRYIIMIIASLGMLMGVTFSSGMMEVARKGIFHPELFYMPELITMFLAVMITDILLLDFFNTFGLPTSTTVSIVFELLGAAVAVSLIKISQASESFGKLVSYINTAKALAIISGILLSVVIAFAIGALIQFITRLIFTFNYPLRLKRYGALWGGVAMAAICYFILIKGAKGASFITAETLAWIKGHTGLILLGSFLLCAFIFQVLTMLFRINILKIIVLTGTFALAMAFAANDLVNFIGVPLAGLNAYQVANTGGNVDLGKTMDALRGSVSAPTLYLLIAGVIMVITLWLSRKSQTVTKTELRLGRQDEGIERFDSSPLSRSIVRMSTTLANGFQRVVPKALLLKMNSRFNHKNVTPITGYDGEVPSWDLVRASVNLMVASVLISIGTSLKLPLSTTYVTFMVAMGTSFADRAWGRESAVYRITGVLTVIGGWFFTAFMAFTVSAVLALAIYFWQAPAVVGILFLTVFLILRNHRVHKKRERRDMELEIFNLKKIKDVKTSTHTSFKHTGVYLDEVKNSIQKCFNGLIKEDRQALKEIRRDTQKIQQWSNIIIANFFKILRLMQKEEIGVSQNYAYTIHTLQEIAESHRDIIVRSYKHIDNHHKGLLKVQVEELSQINQLLSSVLEKSSLMLLGEEELDCRPIEKFKDEFKKVSARFDQNQIQRIQSDLSKTRLSILFYSYIRNSQQIISHTHDLLKIFTGNFDVNNR